MKRALSSLHRERAGNTSQAFYQAVAKAVTAPPLYFTSSFADAWLPLWDATVRQGEMEVVGGHGRPHWQIEAVLEHVRPVTPDDVEMCKALNSHLFSQGIGD